MGRHAARHARRRVFFVGCRVLDPFVSVDQRIKLFQQVLRAVAGPQRLIGHGIPHRHSEADFADLDLVVVKQATRLAGLQRAATDDGAVSAAQVLDRHAVTFAGDHAVLSADAAAIELQLAVISASEDEGRRLYFDTSPLGATLKDG